MTSSPDSVSSANPSQYCIDKALPDGSNLYYACLFVSDTSKPAIIGFHALAQELYDVLLECSDPGIARIKFRWWQEELERLGANEARHPVSRCLQENMETKVELLSLLQESVIGFEQLLMHEQPANLAESLVLFERAAGPIWRCNAMVIGINDDTSLENISANAAAYYCMLSLQYPNTFMTEANCIVPIDVADWSTISQARSQTGYSMPFGALVSALLEQLDQAYSRASQCEKQSCKQDLILNRLAHATGKEILKSECQLLKMRVSLTPIRKLLIASWRNLLLR